MKKKKMNVLMESVVYKYCKNCQYKTKHKLINDKRLGRFPYYSCVECAIKSAKNHRKNYWYKYLAQKANARKKIGSIKLTEKHLLKIAKKQKFKCVLTNEKFNIESKWWKPSLDRIDSNKGYILSNIRLVAWIVNHCRGNLTDKEFIDMCKKVSIFNERRGGLMASKYSKKAEKVIGNKMHKMKGEKKPQKQKVAIALSEARKKGLKVPKKK